MLMKEKHIVEDMQLARVREGGERLRRAGKAEKEARARYEAHAASFVPDMEALLARVLTFLSAAQMISRTYFAGEDILFRPPGSTCRTPCHHRQHEGTLRRRHP